MAMALGLLTQLAAAGLPTPKREHKFHPTRKWRFDFAYPESLLAIEVDGATWSGGRHVRGKGFRDDCRKLNAAAVAGWKVLRFTTDMVESGEALKLIEAALENLP